MPSRSSGFTLLELLISVALLALVLIALAGSATYRIKMHSHLEERSAGVALADLLVKQMRLSPNQDTEGEEVMGLWQFNWKLEVEEITDAIEQISTLTILGSSGEVVYSVQWVEPK